MSFRIPTGSPLLQGNAAANLVMLEEGGETVALQCEEEQDNITLYWMIRLASPVDKQVFTAQAGNNGRADG